MTSQLFTSLTIRNHVVRNRLWVAPMAQNSVFTEDGVPNDWHLVHLGSFARGGAGLVMSEATAVTPEGRITTFDTGIWNDEQADAWASIVRFIHSQGASAGIQLAHAGRKASVHNEWSKTLEPNPKSGSLTPEEGGWTTISASAIPFENFTPPIALDEAGIAGVIDAFVAAAQRSVRAGFDLVEIHAAHGYLLHQFLSPLSNARTDQWGGSLENRARLVLDVVRAVRAAVDVPILVRFSATDWVDDSWLAEHGHGSDGVKGWDEHQTATVAAWAQEAGADLFDISSGGLVVAPIPIGPGYQVPLAETVHHEGNVPVSAVGLITDPHQAEQIVASGQADAIMMGREFLRDPHAPLRFARELGAVAHRAPVGTPPQYRGAFR